VPARQRCAPKEKERGLAACVTARARLFVPASQEEDTKERAVRHLYFRKDKNRSCFAGRDFAEYSHRGGERSRPRRAEK